MTLGRYAIAAHLGRLGPIVGAALLAACGGAQTVLMPTDTVSDSASIGSTWTMHALYSFKGDPDGESPTSVVAPKWGGANPQILGTTQFGGYYGEGTLFGLSKNTRGWSETVLYQFTDGNDGARPIGISVPTKLDESSRVFVPTLGFGGKPYGTVVVLRPNPSGSWKLLSTYVFHGTPKGSEPEGPVMQDEKGNLYGTTSGGGAHNDGEVYRLTPSGAKYKESVLYSFRPGTDGRYPYGGLISIHGALYGTTLKGGAKDLGTVFKLTPSGSRYTESVLYSFKGGPTDGDEPQTGLCAGPAGALFGTTLEGGYYRRGTVFKITPSDPDHPEHLIWKFGGFYHDGQTPVAPVVVNAQGVIYGITQEGGKSGNGTLFVLTPNGKSYKEQLYNFNGRNGGGTTAGPAPDGNGNLYIAGDLGAHLFGVIAAAEGAAPPTACNPGSITINE